MRLNLNRTEESRRWVWEKWEAKSNGQKKIKKKKKRRRRRGSKWEKYEQNRKRTIIQVIKGSIVMKALSNLSWHCLQKQMYLCKSGGSPTSDWFKPVWTWLRQPELRVSTLQTTLCHGDKSPLIPSPGTGWRVYKPAPPAAWHTLPMKKSRRVEAKVQFALLLSASLTFWWGTFPWTSLPELSRSGTTITSEVKQVAPPALSVTLDSIRLWVWRYWQSRVRSTAKTSFNLSTHWILAFV